jgi:uncharacterized protein YqeY
MTLTLKQQLDQDIKKALLSGDKEQVTALRGLKSAILYAEVAAGARENGLDDEAVVEVLRKEAKKRQDSADLYEKGGNTQRRDAELQEKALIETYLPQQMSDEQLGKLVDEAIVANGELTPQTMGKIIGHVKQSSKGEADGARIAAAVKERLS